ncbi:MAG TPA: ABC transporter ATP-binding protein [Candidatus Saccharibacteria bacterium]|nr:ABC transporter ATP-binding protein [Candidatus Saccharibacteria bacterium]HRK94348.1 ABC transporter ATP-binding protein [Candidatus Saccharibacteria bacterium]
MIELAHVSKIYGKKQNKFTALEGINVVIESGATVAIVGKSGSGKSTLMHVMSGLDRVTSGTVTIDGHDISMLKKKALDSFRAQKIGFIFQAFFVQANETSVQNVSLPLEIAGVSGRKRKDLVNTALEQVDLTDKANSKARNLSGGQKQRLAIARAIVNKPSIIFADEPTGNLDSATGDKVEKLLFSFNKKLGSTLVVVTHDEDLAKKCDQQIYLKDGKIVKIVGKKGGRK